MKRTLITLVALAMASVASAASYDNPEGTLSGDFSSSTGEFTLIAVLDWSTVMDDKFPGYTDTSLLEVSVSPKSGWAGPGWVNSITAFEGWSNRTLEIGLSKDGAAQHGITLGGVTSGDSAVGNTSDTNHLSLTENTHGINGKLALAYTFNGGTFTVSALRSDSETWTTLSYSTEWSPNYKFDTIEIDTADVITHLVTYDTALSGEALTAAAVSAVPEPATATLSLLALAGLAARRRRK